MSFTRRDAMKISGLALAGAAAGTQPLVADETSAAAEPFRYCLNTSTIMGQNVGLVRELEIAAAAGYQAVEPWIRTIDQYTQAGGKLADIRKQLGDLGLSVASAIGFAEWIVEDDAQRARGLEEAKRTMDIVAQLGGTRIAAPPAGAKDLPLIDLRKAAERYHALCEIGRALGVAPQAEVWGFSKNLGRLAETTFVAVESGHPSACILPDIYHLHKGGSGFETLPLLSGVAVQVFHVNDYPAEPGRAEITDAHRVHVGDGSAPVRTIFRDLHRAGFRGFLSLELFNRDYWQQDPLEVARVGLEKIRTAVREALESPA